MKKFLLPITILFALVTNIKAQNISPYWSLAGNSNATATSKLGTTNLVNLSLFTNNLERMRLTTSGNVGIGTTTPFTKLHVNGSGAFGANVTGANAPRALNLVDPNAVMRILRVNATDAPAVELLSRTTPNGPNVAYWDLYAQPSDASFRIRDRQTGSNIDRLTVLHTNGNVGIGTTAPTSKLHLNVSGYDAYQGLAITNTNAGGKTLTINQGTAGKLNFTDPGVLDLMTMDFTTGNVGIGTTDPGNYKLKISHGNGGPDGNFGLAIENAQTHFNWELYSGVDYNPALELFFNNKFKGEFFSDDGHYYEISDERLKTNIKPMATILNKINLLKPSTYQFRNTTNKKEYNGFIAQDVMKIFPAMVMHNVNPERNLDVYTLNYSGFGVLAIKGIQELAPIIEEQKKINDEQRDEIELLKERMKKLESIVAFLAAKNGDNTNIHTDASLEQNKPNPFNKSTIISYSIPRGNKGQINIYDQTGKPVKALNVNQSGQSEISGHDLTAGTYTYSLMINGKVTLSKQMLIIK